MTTDPSNPTPPTPEALPDELLLDLVEGTLRSADVERVRAALKADPKLAKRLEAMRNDRREVMNLSDRGVSSAPVGLVADAIGAVERTDLLDGPQRAKRGGALRRLAPALLAACVGVVAVAGWYAHSQGVFDREPDGGSSPSVASAGPGDPGDPGPTGPMLPGEEGAAPVDPGGGVRYSDVKRTAEQFAELNRPFEMAKDLSGYAQGSFGALEEQPVNDDPALGGPMPDLFAGGDDAVIRGDDDSELWSAPGQRDRAPEAVVPDEAATWAREGRLRVVVAPTSAFTDADEFARFARGRLYIALDPTLANGWGITRLPELRPTTLANTAGDGWEQPVASRADDRGVIATVRVPADASDAALHEAIAAMARGMSAFSGLAVRLEPVDAPAGQTDREGGAMALTVDNLLWWRKPAALWSPATVFHLPVVFDAGG